MADTTDKALITFLSRPETYGLTPETPVAHVETHISHVFLAGDRAFKLKKPVRFTFLDFSDVGKRRAACETEVTLNRRTAPEIYLGTVPVRRTRAGLRLGGDEGEVADWLVEMKRFAAEGLLATMADEGRLKLTLIDDLAAAIARFHATAEICRDAGGAESFRKIVEDNLADMEPEVGPIFDRETVR
ncbi:MAG: aminoglycoside phosphotransferase, partial [Parvibaculum sp.]|nr:aminoglycoside phosphotransferase [Parvibaculum sp.]